MLVRGDAVNTDHSHGCILRATAKIQYCQANQLNRSLQLLLQKKWKKLMNLFPKTEKKNKKNAWKKLTIVRKSKKLEFSERKKTYVSGVKVDSVVLDFQFHHSDDFTTKPVTPKFLTAFSSESQRIKILLYITSQTELKTESPLQDKPLQDSFLHNPIN